MALKVLGSFLAVVGLSVAVPVPQEMFFKPQPFNDAASAITATIPSTATLGDIDPKATALAFKAVLPALTSALTDRTGTDMEKMNRVIMSFLPLGRAAIMSKSRNDDYDVAKYSKQQEAAEEVVPIFMSSLKSVIESFPATTLPNNFNSVVDLSNVPVFDSPLVPNSVIRGQRIPATEFVPEIIIPDIKIQ